MYYGESHKRRHAFRSRTLVSSSLPFIFSGHFSLHPSPYHPSLQGREQWGPSQPLAQTQLPVVGSHELLFMHSQCEWQSSPKRPSGHFVSHRIPVLTLKQNPSREITLCWLLLRAASLPYIFCITIIILERMLLCERSYVHERSFPRSFITIIFLLIQ